MTLHVNQSGTWKQVKETSIKDGGVWKSVKEIWIKDAGVWKQSFISSFDITISSNQTNYDVHNAAGAAGWDGVSPCVINLTISSGVTISSNNTSLGALRFDTASWPVGSICNIFNFGIIAGKGGNGGTGCAVDGTGHLVAATSGGDGGPAIVGNSNITINITNASGNIQGGGGGGGGGDLYSEETSVGESTVTTSGSGGGGGGGAGSAVGTGGAHGGIAASQNGTEGSDGSNGTLTAGGAFGAGGFTANSNGGSGGNRGQAGSNGATGGAGGGGIGTAASGGAAGRAVTKNGATVNFVSGNDASHVFGAVA